MNAKAEKVRAFPDTPAAKWVRLIASVLVLPLIGWGVNVEIRLAKIESNRWTSEDAALQIQQQNDIHLDLDRRKADRAEFPQALEEIRRQLARLEKKQDDHLALHLKARDSGG